MDITITKNNQELQQGTLSDELLAIPTCLRGDFVPCNNPRTSSKKLSQPEKKNECKMTRQGTAMGMRLVDYAGRLAPESAEPLIP